MATSYQVVQTITLGAGVNCAETNLAANTAKDLAKVPEGFVVEGIVVEELEKCGASANVVVALTTASDVTSGNVAVGGSSLRKTYVALDAPVVVSATDTLKVTASAALSKGIFNVALKGFVAYGKGIVSETNKSSGDPMYA